MVKLEDNEDYRSLLDYYNGGAYTDYDSPLVFGCEGHPNYEEDELNGGLGEGTGSYDGTGPDVRESIY